ncbi:YusU family protein [Priestia megaterium]|uniref:YusU family protein n=1 Tax=Priestia megaterium TaxID=1404 RepID=UPI003458E6A7
MSKTFQEQFNGLIEKYTELMVGESDEQLQEKVKMWALYNHISKSMPPLTKHWNQLYPDAKAEMIEIVKEIKELNEAHRASQRKPE